MSDQQAHHLHMTNRLYQQQKQQLPISENVPQKLTQFKEKDGAGNYKMDHADQFEMQVN